MGKGRALLPAAQAAQAAADAEKKLKEDAANALLAAAAAAAGGVPTTDGRMRLLEVGWGGWWLYCLCRLGRLVVVAWFVSVGCCRLWV